MAIFVHVVEQGSFRAASEEVGLAPSRVSEIVSDLENHLGFTLLYRTTRKISLTNEGRLFVPHAQEMLRCAEAGMSELSALKDGPTGSLRVSLPAFMSASRLSTKIARFLQCYPDVSLQLSYTDRNVGLVEDGFDLNIRAGWLDDSSLMSRKIGESERILVAGADFLASNPVPDHPSGLASRPWIRYRQRANTVEMKSPTGEIVRILSRARLEVDSVSALYHFACHNLGLTLLPYHLAAAGQASGELVRLFPEWSLRPLGYYAVWPDLSRRTSLTRFFVQFLADETN